MSLRAHYDVVILGGGPAGLAAAISARMSTDLRVLVVEGQSPGYERVGESCPPDLVLLLKRLGVARAFYRDGHATCPGYASVWGRADVGYNDAIVNPMGPSWRLDRRRFDTLLASRAQELGATFAWDTRFVSASRAESEGFDLELSSGSVAASFVVDATGSRARFAKCLGVDKRVDDQLFGTLRFGDVRESRGSGRVQLEALPHGWCYHALLPGNRVVNMIVTDRDAVAPLRAEDFQTFEAALRSTSLVGTSLAKLELDNRRYQTLSIQSGYLPSVEGHNWMAVGDAALSFDPIAAQGILKGLGHGLSVGDKLRAWTEGDPNEHSAYSHRVANQYADYLRARAHLYGLERRWPNSAFWTKRQARPPAAASAG